MGGLVTIVYFIARYSFLIKKMLIEKGVARDGTAGQGVNKRDVAFIVVGLGVGLLITGGFSLLDLTEDTLDLIGWGVVLICGAAGLLIASKTKK